MKLELQVVSLELAKRLKELGCKQESLFWWGRIENTWLILYQDQQGMLLSVTALPHSVSEFNELISAHTVAELGEMLPDELNVNDRIGFLHSKIGKGWAQVYYAYDGDIVVNAIDMQTEADARAKMLVYLLENNLLQ